jgi:uncharacterized MAPEG superfamily protein
MDMFDAYSHAIAAVALWGILMMVLGALSTIGRNADNRSDCGLPKRDYSNVVYRRGRAFGNAIEMSGPFVAGTAAAILAGAAPFWVNVFASLFLVSRIGMAVVHIKTENQPMRSVMFAIGFFCVLILCIMAVRAAF